MSKTAMSDWCFVLAVIFLGLAIAGLFEKLPEWVVVTWPWFLLDSLICLVFFFGLRPDESSQTKLTTAEDTSRYTVKHIGVCSKCNRDSLHILYMHPEDGESFQELYCTHCDPEVFTPSGPKTDGLVADNRPADREPPGRSE